MFKIASKKIEVIESFSAALLHTITVYNRILYTCLLYGSKTQNFRFNLSLCISQFHLRPGPPPPPRANPRELAFFFSHGWQIPGGGSTFKCSRLKAVKCAAVGMKVEGECPAPGIVLMPVFIFVRCNRSQSCSSKEMKRVLRPSSRFLKFEGRKMSSMSWQQLQTDDKKNILAPKHR